MGKKIGQCINKKPIIWPGGRFIWHVYQV